MFVYVTNVVINNKVNVESNYKGSRDVASFRKGFLLARGINS